MKRSSDTEGRPREAGSLRPSRQVRETAARRGVLGLLAVAAVVAASAASSYFPEFYHSWEPKLGAWSTYHLLDARGEAADLTFAVVAEEAGQYWLEVRTKQEGVEGVAAYLVKGDPTDDANVLMVRAQETGGPAMQIDKATLEKLKTQGQAAFGSQATPIGPTVGKLEGMPDAEVKVGNRTLKCRHIRIVGVKDQTAEVWLNDEALPLGIVKLVSGTEQVVLTDFGTGAKPTLKGPFTPLTLP